MPRRANHTGQLGEFWLSKRPNSPNWCRTWFDSKTRQTRRHSLGTADLREAQLLLADYVVRKQEIRDTAADDMPLETILVRYYDRHGQTIASAEQQKIALAYWAEFFAGSMVKDLTLDRQEAFITWLRESGKTDGYISRILSTGRAALNFSYKRQEVRWVPYIINAGKGAPRDRRMNLEEASALLSAIEDEHLFKFTLIAFNTLARPQAILDLTVEQIDFEDRLIDLNPAGRKQTKKHRPVVPITNTLMPWLLDVDAGHIVNWHGQPVKSVKRAFRAARERAGLDRDVTPYTIRHTMATELRRREVSPWELAGIMGHRSPQYHVTEIYARYAPDYLGSAARAIDSYFEDLATHAGQAIGYKFRNLRANSVRAQSQPISQAIEKLVGERGFEPPAPTSRT